MTLQTYTLILMIRMNTRNLFNLKKDTMYLCLQQKLEEAFLTKELLHKLPKFAVYSYVIG